MIAKHVPMRSQAKSSFSGLAEYITDKQDKTQRVDQVAVTNCQALGLEASILEIEATQLQNTRATSDKTFHLLVSFRQGENPSNEALTEIEKRVCAALGYADHQRVSAVHRDTDNLHIHIAINKINPNTGNYHEPYQFHRTLGEICQKLEGEFGLERDNHESRKRGAEGRAHDMERHAGIESLITWVRRECLQPMQQATSWKELHQVMQEHGLQLQLRGNGLVLMGGDGVAVKPSTVARELSKPALEARLGEFQPPEGQAATAARKRYEKPPRPLRVNTVELYAKYKDAQANLTRTRNDRLKAAMQARDEAIKKARQAHKVRRGLAALASDSATVRRTADRGTGRTLAKQNSAALRKELDAIQAEYTKAKGKLYTSHQRQTWADWLRSEAVQGNAEALAAMRSREAATGLRGATVTGTGQQGGARTTRPATPGVKPGVAGVGRKPPPQGQGRLRSLAQLGAMRIDSHHAAIDGITKKGTIIYRGAGASAIRDDGQRLQVSREADQATVIQALRMAAAQLGPVLKLEGSAEFKARAIRAAVDAGLAIKFSDPALEQRRLSLIEQERSHDNTTRPTAARPGTDRPGAHADRPGARPDDDGRRTGRGPGLVQQPGAANVHDAGRDGTAAVRIGGRGDTASKPNIGRIGRKPPPQSQNRLRSLSQLGVVRVASGTQVLLPRDVPRDVEQQGAKPAHALRRPVFGSGLTNAALAAADKYIAEREAKRSQGFDISKHIPYNSSSGELAFAGVRNVEGHALVLLKQGTDTVIVAPIDATTAQRLSRLKIGDPVSVTARGALRTTGKRNAL